MSIKYNDKLIAGKYKVQLITPADTVNSGTIKIATQQEVDNGTDNTTAVTPYYLATKQDKLIAGDNILLDENLIECTVYPDDVTIVQNEDGTLTNIAQKTVNDTIKIDWIGTTAEYEAGVIDGSIEPHWYCYITDDEQYVDYENLMLADLTNIRQEGVETIDNIVTNNLQKADINLDNITEVGEQVIRDNAGIKFELFDSKLADHVLSYEESLGWGLQGTYVYKDAVAGERFGYPEFYAKCAEEFQDASNTKEYLSSNVNLVGSLVDTKGVLSGFSTANYAALPDVVPFSSGNWEIFFKSTVKSISTQQYLICSASGQYSILLGVKNSKLHAYLSNNGTGWVSNDGHVGVTTLVEGQEYYFKTTYNGTQIVVEISTDNLNWTTEITYTVSIPSGNINIGVRGTANIWYGAVDLTESYININGSRWWTGANMIIKNPNGHLFYDINDKSIIDEYYIANGRAWFYGIDTENGRIFLPRDNTRFLIEKKEYTDESPNWYNLYSDGWCEQGGNFVVNSASVSGGNYSEKKLNFIKPFIKCTQWHCQPKHDCFIAGFNNTYVTTYATVYQKNTQTSAYTNPFVIWEAEGYCTETPDVNIYKYICVGNVKSSTAWIDVVTQVQNGVKDIEIAREETLDDVETTKDEAIYEIRSNAEDLIKINRLKMFQPLLLDYVLPYNESKGLALQGTYVYKNAIAGSRYGYSTFYNKCVQEFQNASNTQVYLSSNVNLVGSVVDTKGVLSGFSTAKYATLPNAFAPSASDTWEANINFTTGSNITTAQYFMNSYYGVAVYITAASALTVALGAGSSFNILAATSIGTVTADTEYNVKISFDGTQYTIELNGTIVNTVASTTQIGGNTLYLGIQNTLANPLTYGTIDLNESYININGSRWWSGVDTVTRNPNGHLFYDINDKSIIDEYYIATGRAWMYGVDTENERIFLPRNNSYFRIGDESTVGTNQEAGLPNITGSLLNTYDTNGSGQTGAFYNSSIAANNGFGFDGNSHETVRATRFSASRSSKVYGNSDTVELDSVNMLLYICVGNTESDTSWVDVVTQVENGVLDLENKKNDCIDEINAVGDSYDNLTHRNITNCLLEVPQRIKYTHVNGILTIKAGSVVIVPYGIEDLTETYPVGSTFFNENYKVVSTQYSTDSKFFVWVEIVNDISVSGSGYSTLINRTCFLNINTNYPVVYGNEGSGAITPSTTGNLIYYRTDSNIMVKYDTGVLTADVCSLPILRVTNNADNLYGEITHIFNGVGYVGSTVWVDKDIKGLIPNGRNSDGTLSNIEFKTDNFLIAGGFDNNAISYALINYADGDLSIVRSGIVAGGYDENKNFFVRDDDLFPNAIPIATIACTDIINSFNLHNRPFRAVESSMIDGQWVSLNPVVTVSTSTALGTYIIDLSDVLPNDGYNYQICLTNYINRASSGSGTNTVYMIKEYVNGTWVTMYQIEADQSNWQQGNVTGMLIIDSYRQFQITIGGAKADSAYTRLTHYRRLGTNI